MRYRITHRTTYEYESPVTVGHYLARLMPRNLPTQDCPWHEMRIEPTPTERFVREDYFGNNSAYFEIEGSHQTLEVVARSLVEVAASPVPESSETPPWEEVRAACLAGEFSFSSSAGEYLFSSPLIERNAAFSEYAQSAFPAGAPVLQCVSNLTHRIFEDFTFDPKSTDLATPVAQVLETRRGVCQDFAQVMIACVRNIGLPARYVSGYLETLPPPGQPKLIGADASHAWVSVYCGDKFGWIDADPTNGLLPSDRHVTVAWGRDFSDVSPLRGVRLGAGQQKLTVAVDVLPETEGM